MRDEGAKRAAEEYLAAKLSEEGQNHEAQLNREAAMTLGFTVWQRLADTVSTQIREWNNVTNEQTLTCKETALGDLRIRCAGRPHQMLVHYESRKLLVTIKNTARPDTEPDTYLTVEGYPTPTGRNAHLVRNNEPANLEMLILGHLRVLAGLSQRAE
ncbi:MAG: hypothetical protein M3P45_07665 [Acidobacteriota bacterium]|nr:hypothetical protein [Acidobacteriota bacterium]